MKTLFLVFYGFQEYNGISKKIRYQADALRLCGADVRTCHYEVGNDGSRKWMIDEDVLADLGKGIPAKIKKRLSFAPILQYVRREGIQCVYIRSYHNANPFTIHFVRMLKKQGVRVLLEIPTYPYDHEYSSGMEKVQLYTDKLFRHAFCRYVDFIVTFSSDDRIFGRPTIRISNGVLLAAVRHPVRSKAWRGVGRAFQPGRLCHRQSGTASQRHIQHQDPEKQGICGARVRLRLLRNGR